HRLAHRAAGMMDGGRHIGELHEIAEILNGRIAAHAVEIAHEGRAIYGSEDRSIAADLDRSLRIARMLDVARRRRFQKLPAHALRKAHALALHVGAGLPPQIDRLRIVAELDADLLKYRVCIGFDE